VDVCRAILDRFQLTTSGYPKQAFLAMPQYRRTRSHLLRRKDPEGWLAYRRLTAFRSTSNATTLAVRTEPLKPWLAPCRIEFVADDLAGLGTEDVLPVLEILRDVQLSLVELAVDFSPKTGVDSDYVLAHGVFGKSRPRPELHQPNYDAWGSKKGSKFVKSYFKEVIGAHRVELELRRPFLKKYRIKDVFDFHRLAPILPRHHLWFAHIDTHELGLHLRRQGRGDAKVLRILRGVAQRNWLLDLALEYLRTEIQLTNVHRLLVPEPTNAIIQGAITAWAKQWPAEPFSLTRNGGVKAKLRKEGKRTADGKPNRRNVPVGVRQEINSSKERTRE